MGEIVSVICKQCGYHPKNVTIGCGRNNISTYRGMPVWNTETNELETVNYFDVAEERLVERTFLFIFKRKNIINKGRINSKFIPYTDPKMYVSNKNIGEIKWGDDEYKLSGNYCPKCKSYNVVFKEEIRFD